MFRPPVPVERLALGRATKWLQKAGLGAAALMLAGGGPVFGVPIVTSVSGTAANGSSVTISGLGFGAKSPAAPILWDNFERGTPGSRLSSSCSGCISWTVDAGCPGTYTDEVTYGSGSTAALQHLTTNASCWTRKNIGNQTEVFFSYRYFAPSSGSGDHTKFARLASADDVHATPRMGYTGFSPDYAYLFPGNFETPIVYYPATADAWVRDDYWVRISSDDQPDGIAAVWRDGQLKAAKNSIVTRSASSTGDFYSFLFLPYYNENGTRDVYVDDVYLDKTRARVEICSLPAAPTGTATSHCEIQIPSAWTGDSITVTVNQGTFPTGSTAYVFVYDSGGAVNLLGLPVSFGTAGPVTAPSDVTGVRRIDSR